MHKYIPWKSLRYFGLVLAAGNIAWMKHHPDLENYLQKPLFSGYTGFDVKIAIHSKMISEIW